MWGERVKCPRHDDACERNEESPREGVAAHYQVMEGGRRQQRRRVLAPRAVDGGRHARSDGSVDRGRIRCGVSARRLQEEKETGGDAWSPRGGEAPTRAPRLQIHS